MIIQISIRNVSFRPIEYIQTDGEQPSTSRSLDDDEPDDLSEPLSSTGTERPGLLPSPFKLWRF